MLRSLFLCIHSLRRTAHFNMKIFQITFFLLCIQQHSPASHFQLTPVDCNLQIYLFFTQNISRLYPHSSHVQSRELLIFHEKTFLSLSYFFCCYAGEIECDSTWLFRNMKMRWRLRVVVVVNEHTKGKWVGYTLKKRKKNQQQCRV